MRFDRRRGAPEYGLTVGNDVPHRLAGPAHISLHARMLLRGSRHPNEPEPWDIGIVAYQYTLLDADQHEILAFHLHPEEASHVTTPHLHLGAGAGQVRTELASAHVPSGLVTLASVARLAVEAFAARSRRPTWDAILHGAELALAAEKRA